MDKLICRECSWLGDPSNAHEHREVSAPSVLVCPRCFCELDEATEEDLDDDE